MVKVKINTLSIIMTVKNSSLALLLPSMGSRSMTIISMSLALFFIIISQFFLPSVLAVNNAAMYNSNNSTLAAGSIMSSSSIISTAKSVYNTGTVSLPPSVKGFIIYIPDEAHEPLKENRTISIKNAHYIPSNLVIPTGTSIAFVHGDPNHVHIEIIKDSSGKVIWKTSPIKHPGGSDIKVLPSGSYNISDEKYTAMTGTIKVVDGSSKQQSTGSNNNLVIGGIFVPTGSLKEYKSDFAAAGFQILSEHNFLSKVVQKDIAGPTTLLIYSTGNVNMQDSIAKLKPIIESLPYR